MGGTIRTLKVIYPSKSKNNGRTSMLLFADALSAMQRSLWKSQRLKTWSPRRVRDLREYDNQPRSMFCEYAKAHCPVKSGCKWYFWVVAKILLVSGDASIDGECIVFLSIVNLDVSGASQTLPRWIIQYPPLGNAIVYISPNWSDGGTLAIFQGCGIH